MRIGRCTGRRLTFLKFGDFIDILVLLEIPDPVGKPPFPPSSRAWQLALHEKLHKRFPLY